MWQKKRWERKTLKINKSELKRTRRACERESILWAISSLYSPTFLYFYFFFCFSSPLYVAVKFAAIHWESEKRVRQQQPVSVRADRWFTEEHLREISDGF